MRKALSIRLSFFFVPLLLIYFAFFWVVLDGQIAGQDSSFLFQIVVALMSTGLLAIVTGVMFSFQSHIEGKKENKSKIFEKKIEFYYQVINELDAVFKDEVIDENMHRMLFLVSKSMIVASPDVAENFAELYLSIQNQKNIPTSMKKLIISMRKDLDLLESIKDDHDHQFEGILGRLDASIVAQTRKVRRRTEQEKMDILKEYDSVISNKVKWLRETYDLTPAHIATWRRKLG